MNVPKNTNYNETHIGTTPSGGAYSVAYYKDANGNPCTKDKASKIEICEYSAKGVCINSIYGKML